MNHSNQDNPQVMPTPWRVALALFFTVIFCANGVLIYQANHTWNGLVSKNHYQEGLAYNQVLAAQAAQEGLGWQATLRTVDEKGTSHFTLSLEDSQQPIAGAQVQGLLYRPVHAGTDQTFTMTETSPGIYTAQVVAPLPGWWEVRLTATAPAGEFRYVERVRLTSSAPEGR